MAERFFSNQFQTTGLYLLFSKDGKPILIPENTNPVISEKLFQHYEDQSEELWMDYLPETGTILFTLPASHKGKHLFFGLESRDEAKISFLIQLLRLGFKDLLAQIIFD